MRSKVMEVGVRTIQGETTGEKENGGGVIRGTMTILLRGCYLWVT